MREPDQRALRHRIEDSPYHAWTGITLTASGRGTVEMRMQIEPHHLNPQGVVHGGVIAGLLDSVCGMSLRSTLPEDAQHRTIQLNVNYLRSAASGELVGTGRAVHTGRSTGVSEGEIVDDTGRVLARATATFLRI